ncbi:FAD-binding protein [Telmatocola sphagniphila]|uniref:UDP-N-acetylenolpyruvoylglucosamine reductase n=1 Tax=Telmatocola sphagniphila TaxID=1123043 RepID=A0A8E6BAH9_9BACT|nr:FAD-binding protein [Telmatocola sphagniphila]QVL34771.1 FAD-binding protein [Telmatocola sphagniphila]
MTNELPAAFQKITERNAPLAKYTYLKIGGPAQYLVSPNTLEELSGIVKWSFDSNLPLRVLGDGTNLVVREQSVPGIVLRLRSPAFSGIEIQGKRVKVGGGATLMELIKATAVCNLAGFETLVGITATIGGALRYNAGDRQGEIADCFRVAHVIDEQGKPQSRDRCDLRFGDHRSDLEDPVIHTVEFELENDKVEHLVKRMRRAWIYRKETMPYPHQIALRMFRTPRGHQMNELLSPSSVQRLKSGSAYVSERNSNYLIANPGTKAEDILHLVESIQTRVREHTGVVLEKEFSVW